MTIRPTRFVLPNKTTDKKRTNWLKHQTQPVVMVLSAIPNSYPS